MAFSSAYHPQSDGQSKVVNKAIETYLRCYIRDNPKANSSWLSMAKWCYNTTIHSSIGMSPFEALYGFSSTRLSTYVLGIVANSTIDAQLKSRDAI